MGDARGLRFVMFGDGAWAADSLIALAHDGHSPVAAVTRSTPSAPELAQAASALEIPVLSPQSAADPDFYRAICELNPQLNLSVSYNQIVRPPLLSSAPLGFVNFHAGMLPQYRGRNVINWAIINGESQIGITSHYVDEGIDTGDIILQRTLPIAWDDTYDDVLRRVVANIPDLVTDTVRLIAAGEAPRLAQHDLPGSYFPGREPGDEWLDWADTSLNLYNKIRAITRPGPGALTSIGNEEVTVWRAEYEVNWPRYMATPGAVVGRTPRGVVVKTGDSTLLITEVALRGSEPFIPAWRIGTRLGINLPAYLSSLRARLQELGDLGRSNNEPHS